MRYARHLDYLRVLINHLGYADKKQDWTAKRLAEELSLDPARTEWVLDRFPTLFRRKPTEAGKVETTPEQAAGAAGGGAPSLPSEPASTPEQAPGASDGSSPSPPSETGSTPPPEAGEGTTPPAADTDQAERGSPSLKRWGVALRDLLGQWEPSAPAAAVYSLQGRDLADGMERSPPVDRMLDGIERSADAERKSRRFAAALLATILAALLLFAFAPGRPQGAARLDETLNVSAADANNQAAAAPDTPATQGASETGEVRNLIAADATNEAAATPVTPVRDETSDTGKPPSKAAGCDVCAPQSCSDCSGAGGTWVRGILLVVLIAVGLAMLAGAVGSDKKGPTVPLFTLGSSLSFLAAVGTWAQPALKIELAPPMHDALAAGLLMLLALAPVLLIFGFVFRGRGNVGPLLALAATLLPPAMLAWLAGYNPASFARGLFEPFAAASLAQRIYATMLALLALMALLAAAAVTWWLRKPKDATKA